MMFDQVISFLMSGITALFNWFTRILNAIPGSYKFIITFFTMYLICRFILGPVIGNLFTFNTETTVKKETKDAAAQKPVRKD